MISYYLRPPFVTLCLIASLFLASFPVLAQELDKEGAAYYVEPPYALGKSIGKGSWELINLDGRVAGYGFESAPLAPLPGFSGAPINMFVQISTQGKFIDVDLVSHNEPIFVSGLGQAPFHEFVTQYKGHSITDSLVVGVPYGDKGAGSSLIYLKGVTKATASVRIAHESILGAAFAVAREKMNAVKSARPVRPNLDYDEDLTFADLVKSGLAGHFVVTNKEVQAAYKGTIWEDDDPDALNDEEGIYLDFWIVDVGAPALAKAVLSADTLKELEYFREISPNDQPILVIDNGRHGLVSEDFVRNTSPDLISFKQDGLPVSLRDADIDVELATGVPSKVAMILRTDRRLGFDPTRPFDVLIRAVREHGVFQAKTGVKDLTTTYKSDERFYIRQGEVKSDPIWKQAIFQRLPDMLILASLLCVVVGVLAFGLTKLSGLKFYTPLRLAYLAAMIGFVGWWGQGQLSIVTVLGVIRGALEGQNFSFLLYDPFSLLIWMVVILGFIIWGRGLFCGWLCPFGAMQELTYHLGKLVGLKQIKISSSLNSILTKLKYFILAGLISTAIFAPALSDKLVEVEPFKTAVTVYFIRDWYFVAYAVFWLALSMVLFKGFCRFVCPLGAVMAIGGFLRQKDWIARRVECGSPCQLCKVKCNYQAIEKSGKVKYDECFQCLDCVTIHNDDKQCVPLVLAVRGAKKSGLRPNQVT